MRKATIAFAAFVFASVAMAQLSKHKDWAKSPEADFLTPAERGEFSALKTDDEAEKYIAAYWAKRGGERFKAEISRRIAAADEQFKLRRQRGAESNRGRMLIVLGAPTRVMNSRPSQQTSGTATPDTGLGAPQLGVEQSSNATIQTWYYERGRIEGVPELNARVTVDQQRGTDDLQNAAEINRAIAVVAEKSIINPSGQPAAAAASGAASAPASGSAAAAPPAGTASTVRPAAPAAATGPASAPPPAPAAAVIPAATKASLDAMVKDNTKGSGYFWGGPFRSIQGDPFYSVELAVPADKAGAGVKFAGVVTNEAGQQVASYWEDAALLDMKSGPRTDKVYEKSIVVPPGSYRGAFALYAPDGSTQLASGMVKFDLAAKGTTLEVSPLILASNLTPLTKRPSPTDPFVFGIEKPIRVDPKGTHEFGRDESLWYFYTVMNPAAPEGAAAAAAPPAPAAAAPAGAAPAPAADAPKPRIMATIGVLREGKAAFAPNTSPAEMQPLGPGYYATGSEIPLSSFEPGYYTFTLKVRDLNAPKGTPASTGIDRSEDFIVLKPDGTVPEKKAAAAPAPAAKPKAPPKK
ncbi:MAG: GWxTD domain-containing protein [Acidobacteriota bacterium]|nr:GWxTD domain-containing protein [Acidobacteriota bacterium]